MLTVSHQNLQELIANALERMAFVIIEESERTAAEALERAAAHAAIELRGPRPYTVTVSATAGLVRELASGMLGCEPEELDVAEHAGAAVSELANVFGGELVMQMSTGEEPLQIGLPQAIDAAAAGRQVAAASAAGVTCVVSSDDGDLVVTVKAN